MAKRARVPFIPPQLATLSETAPTGREWWFETKYDGYRMQCHVTRNDVRLVSRNGLDWTDKFADIRDAVAIALRGQEIVLDGEIIVHEKGGRSSFHALQRSLGGERAKGGRARFILFDVLSVGGADQRARPLRDRRLLLEAIRDRLPSRGPLALSRLLRGPGLAALSRACANGEEGIIAKRVDAPYESARTRSWLKVKCGKRQEFVVVGFTDPKGGRAGIGALLLGVYEEAAKGLALRYAGRVGTGFDDKELIRLRRLLNARQVKSSPLSVTTNAVAVREAASVHWVQPKLVAEVSFTEWTPDGLLRHPVYQGLREDKKARAIRREDAI